MSKTMTAKEALTQYPALKYEKNINTIIEYGKPHTLCIILPFTDETPNEQNWVAFVCENNVLIYEPDEMVTLDEKPVDIDPQWMVNNNYPFLNQNYWQIIDAQLNAISDTKPDSFKKISQILGGTDTTAFFAGSGGDATLIDALIDAGWKPQNIRASYYYDILSPNGEKCEYIEGDIYKRSDISA